MPNIHLELTEDQATELHYQLELILREQMPEKTYGFLMRITNKIADQLNAEN